MPESLGFQRFYLAAEIVDAPSSNCQQLIAALLTVTIFGIVPAQAEDFYTPPAEIHAPLGTVSKAEPTTFYLDRYKILRAAAIAQRIMYVSSTAHGEKVAVSGTVLTPLRAWRGRDPRPVISYAAGTQGLGAQCAIGISLSNGTSGEGAFLNGFLSRGYQVVVTDYEGLGVSGNHPFAHNHALGQNVLDAA